MFVSEQKRGCRIVTKFYPYPDLRKFMNSKRTVDENTVADIIGKIMMAISYMHSNKICHRDIKPENILYDPKTQDIKIIDFETSAIQKCPLEKLDLWSNTGTTKYRAP